MNDPRVVPYANGYHNSAPLNGSQTQAQEQQRVWDLSQQTVQESTNLNGHNNGNNFG